MFTINDNISSKDGIEQSDNNENSDNTPSDNSILQSNSDKKNDAPKTGDNIQTVWLFILSLISGTALIVIGKKNRKNMKILRK